MNITGKVTRDAVVRSAAGDKQVVSFSVAVKAGSYRNAQGERVTQTDFYDCAYWRSTSVAPYLTKGMVVEMSGRIGAKAWQDSEGAIRAGLSFRASDIILHGELKAKDSTKTENESPVAKAAPKKKAAATAAGDDDLPF